jgi:hypothetical protein
MKLATGGCWLSSDKHSSLFGLHDSDEKKSFIGLTPSSEGKNGCKDPDTGDLEPML